MSRPKKIKQVETLSQARRHDAMTLDGIRLGLCSVCAAQSAWGRQYGFSLVEPPCDICTMVVAAFPKARVNGWRTA